MLAVFPLAPLFTLASLGLLFLVWRGSGLLEILNAEWLLVLGIVIGSTGAVLGLCRRESFALACDLFCLGTFLAWFVHWREAYRIDAPVFAWYPIYFALLTALLNRQVVHKAHLMDALQRKMIRLIHSLTVFHPLPLAAGLLLSVYFSDYYLFYPIVMTFLLIRCSFEIVLRDLGENL